MKYEKGKKYKIDGEERVVIDFDAAGRPVTTIREPEDAMAETPKEPKEPKPAPKEPKEPGKE